VLQVTIWNTGADAYRDRQQALGDWVTVERRISKAGGAADGTGVSTAWKVYGQNGRRVDGATRKNLIEPMLDHLNIAADNPLCVMTQVGEDGGGAGGVGWERGGAGRAEFCVLRSADMQQAADQLLAPQKRIPSTQRTTGQGARVPVQRQPEPQAAVPAVHGRHTHVGVQGQAHQDAGASSEGRSASHRTQSSPLLKPTVGYYPPDPL